MSQYSRRRTLASVPGSWRLLVPSWIAIAAVTLLVGAIRLAGIEIPMSVQLLGYLIGMVAINLPHGGFENLQNLRTRSARYQVLYAAGFLAMVAAFVGLLFVNAVLGVFLMILLADAIEIGLLIAFFAVVPVVLAVGLYFPLWYTARQVARSVAVGRGRPVEDGAWMADDDRNPELGLVLNWGTFIVGGVFTGLLIGALWVVSPESALSITEPVYDDALTAHLAAGVVFYTVFVSVKPDTEPEQIAPQSAAPGERDRLLSIAELFDVLFEFVECVGNLLLGRLAHLFGFVHYDFDGLSHAFESVRVRGIVVSGHVN
ncbi:hypothetical protein BRC62_00200 [Halobacteriales archaeon QH_10_67_13]|nr:MAG: hypothetical protein BRC62_00200 [Halobacteriales archaeon QH_10_67_13]